MEKPTDVACQAAFGFAVAASKIHCYRQLDRSRDPHDDLLDQWQRNGLAIPITLCLGDRPAACRNRLCARVENSFCAAGVPSIVKHEWLTFDVEFSEVLGLFLLIHGTDPFVAQASK